MLRGTPGQCFKTLSQVAACNLTRVPATYRFAPAVAMCKCTDTAVTPPLGQGLRGLDMYDLYDRAARTRGEATMRCVCVSFRRLGTVDAEVLRIEQHSLFNVASAYLLRRRHAKRSAKLQESQIQSKHTSHSSHQPLTPLWCGQAHRSPLGLKPCKTIKIWATGTVKRVADGLTDKRSRQAKKILLQGAILWAWDADPEYEDLRNTLRPF